MNVIHTAAVAALVLSSVSAAAQQVTGGEVSLTYSRYAEEQEVSFGDDETLSRRSLAGSAEIGINREFSLQGDLGFHDFQFIGETGTSLGLHAIFHANPTSSIGVFLVTESLDSADNDLFGIEAGSALGAIDTELYLALVDGDADGDAVFGLKGAYAVTPQFSLGAGFDHIGGDDLSVSQIALTADYDVTDTVRIAAELGTSETDYDGFEANDAFFGVTASYRFGAARGATFERRGLLELIPGL
ncbi:hypothetical protein LX81_02308 [Palleronia aestuarii]|uniref:Porin n=1 Tax=Palleronia aestuarii TaxID=568105 RepID=A0A2W7NRX8_9RHOB|nr:hypothetical protein [Palleronia aestuarii]PZX16036.1 hypothetical protein LX81_02308 [Palleronia aestuarii]